MFARIYTLFVALIVVSYASVAVALIADPASLEALGGLAGRGHIEGSNDCNTGTIHCCDTTQDSKGVFWQHLLGVFGGGLQGVDGLVGLNCNPITGAASGGSQNCAAQPVCCKDVRFNGFLPVGCNPVNLNV